MDIAYRILKQKHAHLEVLFFFLGGVCVCFNPLAFRLNHFWFNRYKVLITKQNRIL